ncbi:MAG: hypothetical protein DRQ44_07840 [Gammaproteobacteria bacterium]|nr:MAG: hypothetical protein DRQ44_07840 [Gammaproteobacteria bacterium]
MGKSVTLSIKVLCCARIAVIYLAMSNALHTAVIRKNIHDPIWGTPLTKVSLISVCGMLIDSLAAW